MYGLVFATTARLIQNSVGRIAEPKFQISHTGMNDHDALVLEVQFHETGADSSASRNTQDRQYAYSAYTTNTTQH
jgi:hypothetical protein